MTEGPVAPEVVEQSEDWHEEKTFAKDRNPESADAAHSIVRKPDAGRSWARRRDERIEASNDVAAAALASPAEGSDWLDPSPGEPRLSVAPGGLSSPRTSALELSMYILLGLFALVALVFAVNCGAVLAPAQTNKTPGLSPSPIAGPASSGRVGSLQTPVRRSDAPTLTPADPSIGSVAEFKPTVEAGVETNATTSACLVAAASITAEGIREGGATEQQEEATLKRGGGAGCGIALMAFRHAKQKVSLNVHICKIISFLRYHVPFEQVRLRL
ncbi:unnamed protein product [Protopolystoma xenopodis]|uniref:Transmembrane protein n=1 Tax=Protopolystoma xenopodis TaxID=117903 RepID=A0A3S5FHA3_9PLAT|nr:unnamed protein product [Protopolystoma xenopodis]